MSEKLKCPACYRKYKPSNRGRCPQCGLVLADAEAMAIGTKSEKIVSSQSVINAGKQDVLELQIEILQGRIGSLAIGVIVLFLSTISGLLMLSIGTAGQLACIDSADSACNADGLVFGGWGVLIFGSLVGLMYAAQALGRSTR